MAPFPLGEPMKGDAVIFQQTKTVLVAIMSINVHFKTNTRIFIAIIQFTTCTESSMLKLISTAHSSQWETIGSVY